MTAQESDVTIRPAGESDIDVLALLMREYYESDLLAYDEHRSRSALQAILHDERLGRVWLLSAGQEPAGYLALTFGFSLEYGGREAFIDESFVRPIHRGGGLGKLALGTAEAFCVASGISALHLEVQRHNKRGTSFWFHHGFASRDRHVMSKWLDGAR